MEGRVGNCMRAWLKSERWGWGTEGEETYQASIGRNSVAMAVCWEEIEIETNGSADTVFQVCGRAGRKAFYARFGWRGVSLKRRRALLGGGRMRMLGVRE